MDANQTARETPVATWIPSPLNAKTQAFLMNAKCFYAALYYLVEIRSGRRRKNDRKSVFTPNEVVNVVICNYLTPVMGSILSS